MPAKLPPKKVDASQNPAQRMLEQDRMQRAAMRGMGLKQGNDQVPRLQLVKKTPSETKKLYKERVDEDNKRRRN